MPEDGVIRNLLHSQDQQKVEEFINILLAFTEDLTEEDANPLYIPFKKTEVGKPNVYTKKYKQLSALHISSKELIEAGTDQEKIKAGKKLKKAIQRLNDQEAIERLSIYLVNPEKPPTYLIRKGLSLFFRDQNDQKY